MSSDPTTNIKDESSTVQDPSKSDDPNITVEYADGTTSPESSQSKPASSIIPPDVSTLSLSPEPPKRHPASLRSISDSGPQRPTLASPRIPSSGTSSGSSSPLAAVQAARSGRAPSTGSAGGIGVLPAGMQAKMMAVLSPRSFL